ncbi:23S rRNA pseudouridine2605 synthase [Chitinophaga eiseniae]|uniref:Pseudouridine synthase n=1 Tax=Chitinophaga eiseniae TaxID=634771 RepID=A0A1T4S2I3_9BACT|nr:pseudouridine synthase [Chitinophaga eiseniae]SKA22148.1 23S rRNA pseudouridine2605 synthase [Chitinophaga eiseniae]
MKKKQPAKKGPAPFKGRKTDNTDKPAAGNRNRSSFDGERPGRASAKDNAGDTPAQRKRTYSNDGNATFRKRTFDNGEQPTRKRSFGDKDFSKDDSTPRKRSFGDKGFSKDDKAASGKRSFGDKGFSKDDKTTSGKRSFGDKGFSRDDKTTFGKRSFGDKGFSRDDKATSGKRSFGDGKAPVRKGFSGDDRDDEKPVFRKRTYGDKKPFGKKTDSYTRKDESSFHGDFNEAKGGSKKETPSGFNRKKFFDRTNDRFTDKQERRMAAKSGGTGSPQASGHKKESKESAFAPGEMPLNKYIAHCGLCSRRKAVDFIKEGKVTVNGTVVVEPATKVTSADTVTLADKKINLTKNLLYILLNKPKGFITTTDDPEGRKTVMDLIQDATGEERVYPVGRLDRNTSGLLLLTNDGELAQTLAHPKHNIKKIYQVELDKPLTKTDFDQIVAGLTLEDGVAYVDALGYVDPKDKKQIGIEIHSGKNRIVRRIFEHLSYNVEKLDRVMYAGLTKKTLNRGQWRYLNEKEVILLKHFKK